MKKTTVISLVLLFVFSSFCQAGFSDWSNYSKNTAYTFASFGVIDLIQTRRWIEGEEPYEIHEDNIFLPQNKKLYIPAVLAFNYLGYKILDQAKPSERKVMLTLMTIVEIYAVYQNTNLIKRNYDDYITIPLFNIAF